MTARQFRALAKRLLVGSNPRRTLLRAALLGLLTFVVMRFVLIPVRIRGVSMEPTYKDGNLQFVNLLAYKFREPQRGDIVVISMTGRRALYLKRVLGLPGERIAFRDGQLLVNGKPEQEPYLKDRADWTVAEMTVGDGEYYVAGDNRSIRWEHHSMGIVERRKILGSVVGRAAHP